MPSKVRLDDKNLKALTKAFKNIPQARVGILQAKNSRPDSETYDNVKLGALHEFGGSKAPQRSFLRMPITTKLKSYLEDRGAFEKDAINRVVEEKSIRVFMEKIGAVALETVKEAFATGGFGQWPRSDMKDKKNSQTLVEEGFLRDSIGWDVK